MTDAARGGLPLLVLAGAAAISLGVLPGLQGRDADVVAAAVTLDFTLLPSALVYLLFVRTGRLRVTVLVPVFVVGYALALLTIPEEHHGLLEALRLAAVPVEMGVVVYLALLARRALRAVRAGEDADPVVRFRTAAREVLGVRLAADVITTEVLLIHFAFCRRPRTPVAGFTFHRGAGYLPVLAALTMALVVETVALHVLLSLWSRTAAWVLTGLSVYALVWLVGDYRAIVARHIRLTPRHLRFRFGLRWEADVPRERIAGVDLLAPDGTKPGPQVLVASLLGPPNVRVRLHEPVEVLGLYGLRRTVSELRIRVDDGAALCGSMAAGGSPS